MSKDDRDERNGQYRTLTAEHADGWHMTDPHPRCPECKREAKARAAKESK